MANIPTGKTIKGFLPFSNSILLPRPYYLAPLFIPLPCHLTYLAILAVIIPHPSSVGNATPAPGTRIRYPSKNGSVAILNSAGHMIQIVRRGYPHDLLEYSGIIEGVGKSTGIRNFLHGRAPLPKQAARRLDPMFGQIIQRRH